MGKTVYLLVGPRGSGKTTYGKKLMENHLELKSISRDQILIRLFGSVYTDPYSGAQWIAYRIMEKLLKYRLKEENITLLLDCWTGETRERKEILQMLKKFGADQVIALYFLTDVENVKQWFWEKPGIAKLNEIRNRKDGDNIAFFSEDTPEREHRIFHKFAKTIYSDGFNDVIEIYPQKKLISL